MGQSFSWTIPIQVTISVGGAVEAQPGPAQSVVARPVVESAAEVATDVTIDGDWSGRKGYDPSFLGVNIPLSPSCRRARKRIRSRCRCNSANRARSSS